MGFANFRDYFNQQIGAFSVNQPAQNDHSGWAVGIEQLWIWRKQCGVNGVWDYEDTGWWHTGTENRVFLAANAQQIITFLMY